MNWIQALIAGIIQGEAEFLPVSSSGQHVIFYTLTGGDGDFNSTYKDSDKK